MNGRMKWIYTKRRNIFQELIRASGNLKGSGRRGASTGVQEGARYRPREVTASRKWRPSVRSPNDKCVLPGSIECASENAVLREYNGGIDIALRTTACNFVFGRVSSVRVASRTDKSHPRLASTVGAELENRSI